MPGLGGIIGMLLLLPFTFDMEPLSAIALLLGLFAVTTTSDTIASVMLGIPGTAASQATILDGYPLAKRGEAPRAFGAAFAVSAYGGIFGAVALAISLPIVQPLILAFGSPEIFALAAARARDGRRAERRVDGQGARRRRDGPAPVDGRGGADRGRGALLARA